MKSFIPRCTWASMALFAATTVLTGLTACAEKDLPVYVTPESQMKQDLVGSWIAEYSQKGMVTIAAGRQKYGVNAVQTLTFNDDGTGTCKKYICDAGGEAFSCFGGTGNPANGRFHYTVGKDSVITITRDGDGDADDDVHRHTPAQDEEGKQRRHDDVQRRDEAGTSGGSGIEHAVLLDSAGGE